VNNLENLWESILEFFDIKYSGKYSKVLDWNSNSNDFTKVSWFDGIELSYAEHIFKSYKENGIALKFQSEYEDYQEVTWQELQDKVSKIQQYLLAKGIEKGDRIVGVLNNRIETIAIFL